MQLQLDHIGSFVDKNGDRFWILTVIDTFSGKAFATVTATTAIDEVLVFLQEVVFQTFIPKAIHGDKAFTYSTEFVKFCEYWNIKLLDAGPSRSQGMIECFNRILQTKLVEHGVHSEYGDQEEFQTKMTQIVLTYNNTPKESRMELSPNEILLGWRQEVPESVYEFSEKEMRSLLEDRRTTHRFIHEAYAKEDQPEDGYKPGDLVLQKVKVSKKREKNAVQNYGPYVLLENLHNGSVRIQLASGDQEIVPEKDIIRFIPDSQPSEGGGDVEGMVNVQCVKKPGGGVFLQPMPVASEHLANRGILKSAPHWMGESWLK